MRATGSRMVQLFVLVGQGHVHDAHECFFNNLSVFEPIDLSEVLVATMRSFNKTKTEFQQSPAFDKSVLTNRQDQTSTGSQLFYQLNKGKMNSTSVGENYRGSRGLPQSAAQEQQLRREWHRKEPRSGSQVVRRQLEKFKLFPSFLAV